MRVINVSSSYASSGKSVITRTVAEELISLGKRVLVIDNSEVQSGFVRMYSIPEDSVSVDAIRPFLVGELLDKEGLSEAIIHLSEGLDYIKNSEIESFSEEALHFVCKLVQEEYDYIFVENTVVLGKSDDLDVYNLFITRPCETVLKDKDRLRKSDLLVINFYSSKFNVEYKKIGAKVIEYSSDYTLLDNGYKVGEDSEIYAWAREIVSELEKISTEEIESNKKKNRKGLFSFFKGK